MKCRVSIIIVNWNGRHLLADCLDAVYSQSCRDFEVILVDNGSVDGSCEFVRDRYPSVRLVALATNRGFTGGNLAGYAVATGEYIALLNNDTRVSVGWLQALLDAMDQDAALGIAASRIVIDGTNLIDSTGDLFTTAFSGTKVGTMKPADDYAAPAIRHGGCGAAIIYRRSMLDRIGFLDDDFFFNHEDTDLNLRAWLSGWTCRYVPEAIVHHKVNASIGELSAAGVFYFSRNTEWVWVKNTPGKLLLLLLPQRILYEIASFGYFCLRHAKWGAFFRGKLSALWGMPRMLGKRRAVQKLVTRSPEEILPDLLPIVTYLRSRSRETR